MSFLVTFYKVMLLHQSIKNKWVGRKKETHLMLLCLRPDTIWRPFKTSQYNFMQKRNHSN